MKTNLSPPRVLALGFLGLILAGTVLLLLPVSSHGGCSVVDAFFTATSAVCVTGLIVKDTPVDFTIFGQLVILLLIQVGGLGYMTSATLIPIISGRRIGLGERALMKEAMSALTMEGLVRFTKVVFKVTLFLETCGAVFLAVCFIPDLGFVKGIYYGIFHSISAFNNAGFSLFPDNLAGYRTNVPVNMVVAALIVMGGIGFFVISDVYAYLNDEVRKLTQHTKLVMSATGVLIVAGTLGVFLFERTNAGTIAGMDTAGKFLAAMFSSITARTAGFNTLDFSAMRQVTLFMIMLLMFIGAAPGSTGGGVKVTTFSAIVISLWSTIRGKTDAVVFNRTLPEHVVFKAFTIVALSSIFVAAAALSLLYVEESAGDIYASLVDSSNRSYIFEIVSAFGTVGLSVGDGGSRSLSALFSPMGKFVVAVTMYFGRVGPLTLASAMLMGEKQRVRYPDGKVIIG